jgi:acyl carrier protein
MDEHLTRIETARNPSDAPRSTMERIRKVESLRLNVREEELPYRQMLEEGAILDSIAVLEFMTAVEQEFGEALDMIQADGPDEFAAANLPVLAGTVERQIQDHPEDWTKGIFWP